MQREKLIVLQLLHLLRVGARVSDLLRSFAPSNTPLIRPSSDHTFSRSDRFLITNNATVKK